MYKWYEFNNNLVIIFWFLCKDYILFEIEWESYLNLINRGLFLECYEYVIWIEFELRLN